MTQPVLLRASNVSKSFNDVSVVSGVTLALTAGEVHALVGENGAGKSTVIKMLSGVHQPTLGTIELDGHAIKLASPAHVHKLGIFTVHQEPSLMPQLSVAENVFMGFHPVRKMGWRWVNRTEMERRTREVFERLELHMDVKQPAAHLTIAQQQMVEIAKALVHQVRVLILDEPTATLSAHETQILFRIVRKLQSEGTAVLFVSHRLDEVFDLASTITVMRDGQRIGTFPTTELDESQLVKLMVGREVTASERRAKSYESDYPVLSVRELTKRPWFSNVTFDLFPGEILGMAGLVGAGRTNVAEALFGVAPAESGEILISGERCSIRSAPQAIRQGVVYVPEDRHKHGVALQLGIVHNVALPSLSKLSRRGVMHRPSEVELTERMISNLSIKSTSIDQTVSQLSGGNQQKVVFSKWISQKPKIIILDEPTRGVDVGAKDEIYKIIHQLADDGAAILVISSDLPELLNVSDRVLVMREGRVVADVPLENMTPETIMMHATGVEHAASELV